MKLRKKNVMIEEKAGTAKKVSPWYWWLKLRSLCEESSKLGLILEITNETNIDDEINRWFGEPIKALIIPTTLFLTNNSGYPVLSKDHQTLLIKFFRVFCSAIFFIFFNYIFFLILF
jgi:type II protein arginine methyltransferase